MAREKFKRAQRADSDKIGFEVEPIKRGYKDVAFDCEDDIPGGIVLAFAGEEDIPAQGEEVPEGKGAAAIAATKDLFHAAIIDSQQEKFWAMMDGADGGIGVSTMMDIAYYLAGKYAADRPTGESSESQSLPTDSGPASTAGALPGAKTYSRSQPTALTR